MLCVQGGFSSTALLAGWCARTRGRALWRDACRQTQQVRASPGRHEIQVHTQTTPSQLLPNNKRRHVGVPLNEIAVALV